MPRKKKQQTSGAGDKPRSTAYRRYKRYSGPDRPEVVATANLSGGIVATMWATNRLTLARFTPRTKEEPTDFIELSRLASQQLFDLLMLETVQRRLGW